MLKIVVSEKSSDFDGIWYTTEDLEPNDCYVTKSENLFKKFKFIITPTRLPWSVALECIAVAAGSVHSTRWSKVLAENRHFCLPHLHSTTPLGEGVTSEYCHAVCYRKTRMVRLPDGENIEDMFIRFDRIYERVRQADRHRMTA